MMQSAEPVQKHRSGLLAALLHGIAPGMGFLYAGKTVTAFFIPVLMLAWILALGWSRVLLEPLGIAVLWTGLLLFYLCLIPIVFLVARKNVANTQRSFFFQIAVYIAFILWLFLLVMSLLQFRAILLGYETFRLPTRSMAATLIPGDYIVVDTWTYQEKPPATGDVVVFRNPLDGRYFTKRIIGMPGEKVSIRRGVVSINGRALQEPYVLPSNNRLTSNKDFSDWTVPSGHYFMLGDNRDHSNDSRVWGFLSTDAILGKVTSIWFSFSGSFRLERIHSVE